MNRSAISKMLMKIYSRISDPANNHKFGTIASGAGVMITVIIAPKPFYLAFEHKNGAKWHGYYSLEDATSLLTQEKFIPIKVNRQGGQK